MNIELKASKRWGLALLVLWLAGGPLCAATKRESPVLSVNADSHIVYSPDAQGNRVPDFSCCGYAQGNTPIPNATVRVAVAPIKGDSTARIQQAIDYVSGLPQDTNGLRGAVLLLKGRHELFGGLKIAASGVVLRGQGTDENGTVLFASGVSRRTLIRIVGRNDCSTSKDKSWQIKDDYVPVGATSFHVLNAADDQAAPPRALKAGDTIRILRPSTQAWIEKLGMTEFGGGIGDWRLVWKPGSRDLVWDRQVKSNENGLISVDAPITTAIEKDFGGGRVEAYGWPGRIANVGVENLRCESAFDSTNPKDEEHSWFVVTMENAENAWVRQLTAVHFAGSLAAIYETCKCVTVEDCLSLQPVSEVGGYRRHTFFTIGQMTLFLRCFAEHGRHDFSVGHCAAGPNAFVQCEDSQPLRDSGPIESWGSGVLYDNVRIDGNGLSLVNRSANPSGAGWSAANSVIWQCSASFIRCENPPTAHNWAFGCWGEFEGDGIWRQSNESVKPESLYLAQLSDRIGSQAASRVKLMHRSTEERSNPTVEEAADLIAASTHPAPQLSDFIASASARNPIPSSRDGAKRIEDVSVAPGFGRAKDHSTDALHIENGWLSIGDRLLTGAATNVAWWRGNIRPSDAPTFEPDVTRFVPGRIGPGFTDDLDELADTLAGNGVAALDYHYGLWYERRRDDHERVRRVDGDVWPPFYEMPFARTGQDTAWNGLSKYDLTKYNPWYWNRLQEFAGICDSHGLVLFHQNYFQHNILEAGAHWADCPWRSANNINDTGFPEPPPYAGDKRIFMAEQFYDVTHPVRRKLHNAYIRQCLNNFATNSNVIQFTSAEYTGPLSFMQFWLDTIAEWERETGRHPLVALSCTKDVQDAILSDPERSAIVNAIDFRYWWTTAKGTFAPKGGQNLAPRQFERQWRGGRPTDIDLARMASEYRLRYPGKAVICDFETASWAYTCAGGSMPRLPRTTDPHLREAIPKMKPWPEASGTNQWILAEKGKQYLAYFGPGASRTFNVEENHPRFHLVNPTTGIVTDLPEKPGGSAQEALASGSSKVVWITVEP